MSKPSNGKKEINNNGIKMHNGIIRITITINRIIIMVTTTIKRDNMIRIMISRITIMLINTINKIMMKMATNMINRITIKMINTIIKIMMASSIIITTIIR